MTISKELFLSILAMDSYNREYGAGLEFSGTSIGTATFNDHNASGVTTSEYQTWQNAGFYAAAYSTQYGTVISYRGTDNPDILGAEDGASEIWHGWIAAAGIPASQPSLALQFYNDVTQSTYQAGPAANTILTGSTSERYPLV